MSHIQHFPDFIFEDHLPLENSNHDSQSLPMKFRGWNFHERPVDRKNLKHYIPQKFVHVLYYILMMRMESFLLIMATLGKVDEFNMSKEKEERSLADFWK